MWRILMYDEVMDLLHKIDGGYEPSDEERTALLKIENFSSHSVESIPASIGELTNLRHLDMSNSDISDLPASIGNLTNLQHLDMSYSNISDLPASIGNLMNLRTLFLRDTPIRRLPESIGNLKCLQSLNLSATKISELPESIVNLTSLQSLNLSHTQIREFPEDIVKLTNLQSLYLNDVQISGLPEGIVNLKNLQNLYLSGTEIREFPASIENLTNLRRLELGSVDLNSLPEGIEKLANLHRLDLSSSRIKELPENIGNLRGLKQLLLEDCFLNELPQSLLSLDLDYKEGKFSAGNYFEPGIYINGLKLKNQPVEIFFQSRDLIINYYESVRKEVALPINECKVVFLGDGGAGKSLIIDRLMHDGIISSDFDGESTPGICISSKEYAIGKDKIKLHFWDFGGQAVMHSMHRLFLTNRTLYVVVTNARDNKANEQAWYWIRNIRSFANGAPVLLLVNQKDQNPSANVNENGLRKEYPEMKQVRIISALKDSKAEFNSEVRDAICQIVYDMETVHTLFSKSWLSLMNELQEMKEDYITSDVFYGKCFKNKVGTERDILDKIVKWYRDLGVCFYSKAHPVSARYMVLKPRWLLNALYVLVFNGRKYASNGIISEKDIYTLICEKVPDDVIKKVWNDIAYRPEEVQYIVNVLLDFELIYRLDNERFFIPMLCDENEPEEMDSFDSEETFHVRFDYAYLPENVLHRLMVRHGYELNTDIVWRTGAVFERRQLGWSSLVRIKDNGLDVYAKADNQKEHPVNSYLDMVRGSVYQINDELGLTADERIAYRKDGLEDHFDYEILSGSKKAGQLTIYSGIFKRLINIDDILGIIKSPDQLTDDDLNSQVAALLDSLMAALEKLQGNSGFYDADENKCNSFIRDLLEMRGYSCKDQTLHGTSATGRSDGELDILIRDKDRDVDITIYEALKLKGFGKAEQQYLLNHLKKLIDNYNPKGFSHLFLVSYVSWSKDKFNDLAYEYGKYVMRDVDSKFVYRKSGFVDSYNNNYTRCLKVGYDCGGIIINVYHIIVRVAH